MKENIKFKEKEGKGLCDKCGVKITKDNWGRIDFVNGILLCRKCVRKEEEEIANEIVNNAIKLSKENINK